MLTIVTVYLLFLFGIFTDKSILSLLIGAGFATVIGFIDDVYDIKASIKLTFQASLALFAVFIIFSFLYDFNANFSYFLFALAGLAALLLVWCMNMVNFMDGIDGLAASTTMIICWIIAFIIFLTSGLNDNAIVLLLLGLACFSFLFFNFPPATLFMGDSGSLFLGYCLGSLLLMTSLSSEIGIWVWLTILSYFLGDTVSTTLYRLVKVEFWYDSHRSHAYQNLARIWDSHFYVTLYVSLYHLFWLGPLAICSELFNEYEVLIFLLGIIPVIIFNFLYGPRLSES